MYTVQCPPHDDTNMILYVQKNTYKSTIIMLIVSLELERYFDDTEIYIKCVHGISHEDKSLWYYWR